MKAQTVMVMEHGINDVYIRRDINRMDCLFTDIFMGFDNLECVQKLFGKETCMILTNIDVKLYDGEGYMWVNDENASLNINMHYLRNGAKRDLYLDAIHELTHIKQLLDGENLYNERYKYVNRPTEMEAYLVAVKEAKRMHMSKEEIEDYLKVDWVSKEDLQQLYCNLGLEKEPAPKTKKATKHKRKKAR